MTIFESIYVLLVGLFMIGLAIKLFVKELEFKSSSKIVEGVISGTYYTGEDIMPIISFYDDFNEKEITFKSRMGTTFKRVGNKVKVRVAINESNSKYELSTKLHFTSIFIGLFGLMFSVMAIILNFLDIDISEREVNSLYIYLFCIPFLLGMIFIYLSEKKRWLKKIL